jgi:sugar (pentulose or hexulose) kinase
MEEGRPLLVRTPDAKFDLSNLMRSILYSAMGALKIGMDILIREEHVEVDKITGHGGWFNSGVSAAKVMAAALDIPVSTMATAGEGGPWGQAIHASYMINKEAGETLDDFLSNKVFADSETVTTAPDAKDVEGFDKCLKVYKAGLPIERAAIDAIK